MTATAQGPAQGPPGPAPEPAPTARRWLRFAAGVVLVALAAASFAIAFRGSLSLVLRHVAGAHDVVSAMRAAPRWARVLLPCGGGLLAGVMTLLAARGGGGRGVGDVMEAVVLGRVRLSMRVTLLKSLGSWCAIATGGSLGREGPLIQFGGAAGKLVSTRLGLSPRQARTLIAAGTAAGFAAAYNTPFAAVLFVLEVVTGVVVLETIVPTLIATVIATAATRAAVGAGPIYGARAFILPSSLELGAYALLGVLCALAGQGIMRLLALGERLFRRPRLGLPLRPALGGLLAGAVVAAIPEVAGNGYEPLNALLDGSFSAPFVLALIAAKLVASTASVSSGSPGGVFTPTMLIGGGVGFLFGAALAAAFGTDVGPAGGYALVGLAATTAATTHAPLMAAVLAFELSSDYAIVLPLLLATAVATGVSRWLRRDSIYTAELSVGWELTLEGRRLLGPEPKGSAPCG